MQYPAGHGGEFGRPLGVFGDVAQEGAEVGENGADEIGARFDDSPGHGRDAEVGWIGEEVLGEEFCEADDGRHNATLSG